MPIEFNVRKRPQLTETQQAALMALSVGERQFTLDQVFEEDGYLYFLDGLEYIWVATVASIKTTSEDEMGMA